MDGFEAGPLELNSVVDHELCSAYDFKHPWGHQLELDRHEEATNPTAIDRLARLRLQRFWWAQPSAIDETQIPNTRASPGVY